MVFVEREIEGKFKKLKEIYSVIALVGPRQVGKTTFLKEMAKNVKSNYVLFDDPDVRDFFDEDIKKFEKQYVEGYDVVILDEVQYCSDSGRKLKYLADKGHKLWITSSSELILSKDVLSFLVGRVSILKLYPFSFEEFLKAKNQKALNKEIEERLIWEYSLFGGYPKVVLTEDFEIKKTILKDLYETTLLKDISQNFSIEDIKSLENFSRYLALNSGGLVSYNEISKNLNISFQTIKKYENALEKVNLIYSVSPFFKNKTKEITKQPKIYFVDLGMRNVISKNFSLDVDGKSFENLVFSEILKKGFNVRYWRTKTKIEIDFVIEKEKEIIPIETKLKNPEKIEANLRSFIREFKPKRAFVVFYNGEEKKEKFENCEIFFLKFNSFLKMI